MSIEEDQLDMVAMIGNAGIAAVARVTVGVDSSCAPL